MVKIMFVGEPHLGIPNSSRYSRHTLSLGRPFPTGKYPLARVWRPFDSLSSWQLFANPYNVLHSFNSILYTDKPWLITFEDHNFLYRESRNRVESFIFNFLNHRLTLDNCRKLIAISDYAKTILIRYLENDFKNKIIKKIDVIHPSFTIKSFKHKTCLQNQNIQLIFIGNHFARKGGIVALRLAKKAKQHGMPLLVHIISGLKHGLGVPTDFPDQAKYTEDLKLLDLDNVIFHRQIPNTQVLELLKQSDFQLMATLHDTYGYSIIEGFSVATPAITTNVCALPEFVHHEENGYLLKLPLKENRHWGNWLHGEETKTEAYWDILNQTYDQLVEQAWQQIGQFLDRQDKNEHYESLSAGALNQAKNVHNAEKQNEVFDNLYAEAAGA